MIVRHRRARRASTVQHIYDDLHSRIVGLLLPPGAVISKHDLATEFGVSQTPVREALLRLEEEGLVDIFPQSRTVVSLIDIQDAREAHFLRLCVEVEIARRLSGSITSQQVEVLRELLLRQRTAFAAGDLVAFTQFDDRMHQHTYEFAGVVGLWELIQTRRAHIDRLRFLKLPTKGKVEAILEDHTKIVDALERHDAAAAEAAVRVHLNNTVAVAEIDGIRSKFPQYFDYQETPERGIPVQSSK